MFDDSAVEGDGKFAIRRHGDVDGEIPQLNVATRRAERPLVREQHRAIGGEAGPCDGFSGVERGERKAGGNGKTDEAMERGS